MASSREYKVVLKKSAVRTLAALPRREQLRIGRAIDSLRFDPRPTGVEKLSGIEHFYRIRKGDYRIIYSVEDAVLTVVVIRIGHRKDIYHRL